MEKKYTYVQKYYFSEASGNMSKCEKNKLLKKKEETMLKKNSFQFSLNIGDENVEKKSTFFNNWLVWIISCSAFN